jgi:hypothetical protein
MIERIGRSSFCILIFTTEAPLLLAVWNLLGEYEAWITTAVKTDDPNRLSPLDAKPILVITQDSELAPPCWVLRSATTWPSRSVRQTRCCSVPQSMPQNKSNVCSNWQSFPSTCRAEDQPLWRSPV